MPTKDRVKIRYLVTVKRATAVPEKLNGCTLFLAWRRGSKKNSGLTKRALVRNHQASWDESFSFMCTLARDSTTGLFDAKTLTLILREDVIGKKKDTKTLSTARLDLGDYVNEDGSEPILLQLKLKRLKETCSLVLSIQTQWVKLNNQLIKQKVEGLTGQTQGSSKNIISTFAGDFEVETDPEGLTETSMGTTSGSDDELYMDEEDIFVANDDYEDEKERNIPEVSKGEEVNYRRKVELLEQECYERGKTIRSLEEQLHSAKKTLKSLQKAQGGQQWSISTKGKQDKPGPSAEIETETSKDIVQTLQRRIQILEFVECNIYQAKKLVLSKDGMPVVGEYMFIWMVNNHILDDSPNGSSVIAAGDEKSTISKVLNAIHACAKRAKVHEKGYWLSVACYFLHMLHKDSLSGSLAQFLKESVMTLITSIINNLLCDVYHDLDPVLIPAILEQPSSFLQQEEKRYSHQKQLAHNHIDNTSYSVMKKQKVQQK
ncbi:hypothetical protein QOT17_022293 [Balamuthia mandrillaris]